MLSAHLPRVEPTLSEMQEQERKVREEIMGRRGWDAPSTFHNPEPGGRVAPFPAPVASPFPVIVNGTKLTGIDFENMKIETNFGDFDLTADETVVLARFSIQALTRNLQNVIAHLEQVHGVTEAVARAEEELKRLLAEEAAKVKPQGADPDRPLGANPVVENDGDPPHPGQAYDADTLRPTPRRRRRQP